MLLLSRYTALHHAAQQGHINIVNILLEHKADANATTTVRSNFTLIEVGIVYK